MQEYNNNNNNNNDNEKIYILCVHICKHACMYTHL